MSKLDFQQSDLWVCYWQIHLFESPWSLVLITPNPTFPYYPTFPYTQNWDFWRREIWWSEYVPSLVLYKTGFSEIICRQTLSNTCSNIDVKSNKERLTTRRALKEKLIEQRKISSQKSENRKSKSSYVFHQRKQF